ncbi:ATP-dependent DNA helicase hus2/rqh1 [Dictyocoela muelleri]|nr:ATP-dependent DNA helicase hus2/rqh1 [Dictyocoela muelleri]
MQRENEDDFIKTVLATRNARKAQIMDFNTDEELETLDDLDITMIQQNKDILTREYTEKNNNFIKTNNNYNNNNSNNNNSNNNNYTNNNSTNNNYTNNNSANNNYTNNNSTNNNSTNNYFINNKSINNKFVNANIINEPFDNDRNPNILKDSNSIKSKTRNTDQNDSLHENEDSIDTDELLSNVELYPEIDFDFENGDEDNNKNNNNINNIDKIDNIDNKNNNNINNINNKNGNNIDNNINSVNHILTDKHNDIVSDKHIPFNNDFDNFSNSDPDISIINTRKNEIKDIQRIKKNNQKIFIKEVKSTSKSSLKSTEKSSLKSTLNSSLKNGESNVKNENECPTQLIDFESDIDFDTVFEINDELKNKKRNKILKLKNDDDEFKDKEFKDHDFKDHDFKDYNFNDEFKYHDFKDYNFKDKEFKNYNFKDKEFKDDDFKEDDFKDDDFNDINFNEDEFKDDEFNNLLNDDLNDEFNSDQLIQCSSPDISLISKSEIKNQNDEINDLIFEIRKEKQTANNSSLLKSDLNDTNKDNFNDTSKGDPNYTFNDKSKITNNDKSKNIFNDDYKITFNDDYKITFNDDFNDTFKNEIPIEKIRVNNPYENQSDEVYQILNDVFKLTDFRQNQEEIIRASLDKEDIFVLMPTGGGKSLCFQLPALLDEGVTIVISPLISLIHDQITNLLNKNIIAMAISSNIRERNVIYQAVKKGICKILYVTPEMLVKNIGFQEFLKTITISRFVIDEAHCMSQWGNDFRPDYKELGFLKKEFNKPIICLTATATSRVEKDILKILNKPKIFRMSFNRRNLKYYVKPKGRDSDLDIVSFINTFYPNSLGIIYCFSKKDAESLSERLNSKYKMKSSFYHAGLSKSERRNIQNNWGKDFKIIIATIAFGMGIDRKDVRFVIHYSLPKSLEGYYQETGRAGRDNLESVCVLFYNYGDKKKINFLIEKGRDRVRQREELEHVVRYCENNKECRRKQLLKYFGEDITFCDGCDVCELKINSAYQSNQQSKNNTNPNSKNNFTYDSNNNLYKGISKGNTIGLLRNIESVQRDLTSMAIDLQQIILSTTKKITLPQLVDVYRGSTNKKAIMFKRVKNYGKGKSEKKEVVEKLIRNMLMKGFLKETIERAGAFCWTYLTMGKSIKEKIII